MNRRIDIKKIDSDRSNSNGSNLSRLSNSWIFKIIAIAISSFFLFSTYNSVMNTLQKRKILDKAEREVEELRISNLYLSIQIKDMSSDKYLEKEARDRLNFGGKDEVVFVIPDNTVELAKKEVEEILTPELESVHKSGSNIHEWFQFVVKGI